MPIVVIATTALEYDVWLSMNTASYKESR